MVMLVIVLQRLLDYERKQGTRPLLRRRLSWKKLCLTVKGKFFPGVVVGVGEFGGWSIFGVAVCFTVVSSFGFVFSPPPYFF